MGDNLTSLAGYPLFRFPIDASKEPDCKEEFHRDIIEFAGTTRKLVPFDTDFPITMSLSYTMLDRPEIGEILTFFLQQKGRYSPFWFPSFQNSFTFLANPNVGNTVFVAEDTFYYRSFKGYERIFIRFFSGYVLTHKITDVALGDNAGEMKITVSPAFDRSFTADSVEFAGILYFGRFDTDDIEIKYSTSDIAATELSLVELPDEAKVL